VYDAYICGPMAGKTDLNKSNFAAVKRYLFDFMHLTSVIPHDIPPHPHESINHKCPENFRRNPSASHAECCYLRGDIIVLLRECRNMYVLPGWNASNGGRLELMVAAQCGIPTYFVEHNALVTLLYSPRANLLPYPDGHVNAKETRS
jgi:hypothetical protein